MLKRANCPVCGREIEISEDVVSASVGCPACGKSVTLFRCPYCNSEFTSDEVGESAECVVQAG